MVVDPKTQQAHALSGTLAEVWLASATGVWTGPVSPEFDSAIDTLLDAGLLVAPTGLSRRRMLVGLGGAVAMAGIASVALPMAEAAASLTAGNQAITLSPTSGPRGTLVTVAGTNFFPSGSITSVTIGGITVTPSSTVISGTGSASFTFVVPNGAA
ncbi:MAG: hypothetical protein QOG80_1394, partial [Pseudonocardiales bacterium]|nr:hypothetical protein [Pseudonocardiales bacterium]